MIQSVKRFIAGRPATTLFECRHCGRTAEDPVEHCESCGSNEIATYRIPQ